MRGLVPGLPSPHPLGPNLPAVYQEDTFALAVLDALDEVLAPVLSTLDNLAAHVDPGTCPDDWVDWLGTWTGVQPLPLPLPQRRVRLAGAAQEQAESGTLPGLRAALARALGVDVEVTDSGGTDWSPVPGGALPGTSPAVVTVRVPTGTRTDLVQGVARALVPAHVRLDVEVRP